MAQSHHRVIIIGAGSAGLCTAYHLQKIGINDFILLEKGEGLGGTWFWNQYPGAECDVQSHLYSFSFEPNPNWSRPFAGQEEILRYFNHIADKYDIRRRITFNTEISALNWQDDNAQWRITTADGSQYTADIVVSDFSPRMQQRLENAMSEITAAQRQSVAMAFFQGLTHQEIADMQALPVGTVKSHIRRGLSALKSNLDDWEDYYE